MVPESQTSVLASMSSLEVRYVADDCVRAVSGSLGQAKIAVKAHGMSCTRFVRIWLYGRVLILPDCLEHDCFKS